MMRTIRRPWWVISGAAAAVCSVVWLGAPSAAWADPCGEAVATLSHSSAYHLGCAALHRVDDGLRRCSGPAGGAHLEQSRRNVSVALGRCACINAPDAAVLTRRLPGVKSAYALARLVSEVEQARSCASTDDQRAQLAQLSGELEQLKGRKAQCAAAGTEVAPKAPPTGSCYELRLRRAAIGYWIDCEGGAASGDPRIAALDEAAAKVCVARTSLSCEATLATADQMRRAQTDADTRELWDLVTTQLISAGAAQAGPAERSCATRLLATAVPDSAVSDRADRSTVEAVSRDPQLRERFATELKATLKDSGQAQQLARMLTDGVDIKQVLEVAGRLSDDERRRFFSVAGGLGRALEATRAFSAFEQNARGFDIVISPPPAPCKYAEFIHVLLAGVRKATPARVEIVEPAQAAGTVAELVAARTRSCGPAAAGAAGPGCGAVIAVQIEDHGGRGAGEARLQFVAPDGQGGVVTRQTTSVRIREFQSGCGASSEESAAALKLVFDLQFAFATNPREAAVVLERPVRTESCGLRPLPPSDLPSAAYDGKGLRIEGQALSAGLAGPADGAREALRAWKYSVGELDGPAATAELRFSSSKYRDGKGNDGVKLEADLMVRDQRAASFATVVFPADPECHAALPERYLQAGRMIGNEVGSFLAYQANRAVHGAPGPSGSAGSGGSPGSGVRGALRRVGWVKSAAVLDTVLVLGGLVLIGSDLPSAGSTGSTAFGGDLGGGTRYSVGEGMLLTGAAGAVALAVYASTR